MLTGMYLEKVVEDKVQHIGADFRLSFDFCLIQKKLDKAHVSLIADLHIPLNDQNKTNPSHGLPVIVMPIKVDIEVDANQQIEIMQVQSILEEQGCSFENVFRYTTPPESFDHKKIINSISSNRMFINNLASEINKQKTPYFIEDCLSVICA